MAREGDGEPDQRGEVIGCSGDIVDGSPVFPRSDHSAIYQRCLRSPTIVNPQISKGDITQDILITAIRSAVGILTLSACF